MQETSMVTKDERTNAVLAHASILLGIVSRGTLGIVLAFLIWWTQRKSPFASRQAAQALVYQLLGILVALAAWMTWGMLMLGSVFVPLLFDAQNPEALQPYTMIPALLLMVVPITVMLVWTGYGVYAAWRVWKGHDFSYPVLGRWFR